MRRRSLVLIPLLAALPVQAQPQRGRVILRVTGRITGAERSFDLAELEALGLEALRTRTTWTGADTLHFSGVPLARLLRAVGAQGDQLRATALNDYAVNLPREDADRHGAFLATRQDGVPLRVRDRGPIWLIYPWSARPDLDRSVYRDRAIWQLRHIDVS
ncbi:MULTISPECIES: molybdopterin-dependent oxidoreductase [Roseomonadaceae]|uniref:Molybdopterin-dependent oxidoreductase n=1 Tax=Falsiroseomonas oleicola TaxID=2801474 RepID=A0ABS6H501_9PROT|nr:molybdopterin-dependent oxidoreductase [Roseomonas oleicola]MBU8543729.1 molybdopterin-dependent oxidoreductase [Roseomonas oleicola]